MPMIDAASWRGARIKATEHSSATRLRLRIFASLALNQAASNTSDANMLLTVDYDEYPIRIYDVGRHALQLGDRRKLA
jgi:hypothetical protein